MPYVSGAQRGWAHTPAGTKALGGPSKVAEWDHASKGQHVPGHVGGSAVNKGYQSATQSFAKGGAVLGKESRFMKTPDEFRDDKSNATDETWGKGMKGDTTAPAPKGKSLPPVKPRS